MQEKSKFKKMAKIEMVKDEFEDDVNSDVETRKSVVSEPSLDFKNAPSDDEQYK